LGSVGILVRPICIDGWSGAYNQHLFAGAEDGVYRYGALPLGEVEQKANRVQNGLCPPHPTPSIPPR